MRDVVTGFYIDVLKRLIADNVISREDGVLVVCGGPLDEKVMRQVGFTNFTITNLDTTTMVNHKQDAESLTYDNGSFDVVIAHAGLHHCRSPHRALLEMYRVSRKCAVAFEARESLLMKAAVRLGLTEAYELSAISSDGKNGGVADSGIPNFIYRWTEHDVYKTVASFDAVRQPDIRFFYDFRLPLQRFSRSGNRLLYFFGRLAEPISRIVAVAMPKQCNEFAFAILKSGALQPWITA